MLSLPCNFLTDALAVLPGGVVSGRRKPLYETLAMRLRKLRTASGIKPAPLCLAAGVSNGTISNVERGTIPGIDTTERIARALGVSPCFLAFGVEGVPLPALTQDEALRAAGAGLRALSLREAQGLSLRALAAAAGISGPTVAAIEGGVNLPSVATAEALAVALGVSPCWLCYAEGPDPIVDPQGAAAELTAVKFRPPRSPRKPSAPRHRRSRRP